MTDRKRLYSATVSYRTPGGRRVLYGAVVAARNLTECAQELHLRLASDARHGRRRIAEVLTDFSADFIAMQISTGGSRGRRHGSRAPISPRPHQQLPDRTAVTTGRTQK